LLSSGSHRDFFSLCFFTLGSQGFAFGGTFLTQFIFLGFALGFGFGFGFCFGLGLGLGFGLGFGFGFGLSFSFGLGVGFSLGLFVGCGLGFGFSLGFFVYGWRLFCRGRFFGSFFLGSCFFSCSLFGRLGFISSFLGWSRLLASSSMVKSGSGARAA